MCCLIDNIRKFVVFTIILSVISCYDESINPNQKRFNLSRDDFVSGLNNSRDKVNKVDIYKKTTDIIDRLTQFDVLLMDFGPLSSPYVADTTVVSPYNRSVYHRWIDNESITSADSGSINPVLTDFLMGIPNNEIQIDIPSGKYEITFISGSVNSDVPAFRVLINQKEYRIASKEFVSVASKKGYFAFNTIDGIEAPKSGLRIKFLDNWLLNGMIIRRSVEFGIKKYSELPKYYSYDSDFYKLLERSNAIKWSKKFGYNPEQNWDYVVQRSNEILSFAGLINVDELTRLNYLANYVDRLTRETCCEIPEDDILNSPVDILDPDGYKKGSCFGMARLIGVIANYYGIPARLVGYFIDSDFAEFPSLFSHLGSPLFAVRGSLPYSTFAIGGYNHTEVEVFYGGRWRLITNYFNEPHLAEFSAIDVVNDRSISTVKRAFYDNVQDVMYINMFITNINREPDYCLLPYSYAFYDLDTAASIYPEKSIYTFKTDNHTSAFNSLRIGRFWGIQSKLRLSKDFVRRIGRSFFVPDIDYNREYLTINLLITYSNNDIESNLNFYINGKPVEITSIDRVMNMNFKDRIGGVYQFRGRVDQRDFIPNRINDFDIEIKNDDSIVEIVVGSNDSRISDLQEYTYNYCNRFDLMKSRSSYYYYDDIRYQLYNNPLIFLEIQNR